MENSGKPGNPAGKLSRNSSDSLLSALHSLTKASSQAHPLGLTGDTALYFGTCKYKHPPQQDLSGQELGHFITLLLSYCTYGTQVKFDD